MTTRNQILAKLEEISELYPTMRFGQLVANIALWAEGPTPSAVWEVEDDQFLATLQGKLAPSVKNQKPAA